MRWAGLALKSSVLVAVLALAASQLGIYHTRELTKQVEALSDENARLVDFAQRLQASRRVAQVDVVKQYQGPAGQTVSVLLWQEIGADGLVGKPLAVEAAGEQVYFEGMVIKFDHGLVAPSAGEPRTSMVMFRRIFGELQAPESGFVLGPAARPPILDAQRPGESNPLDEALWQRFWELASNPAIAETYGVRVAQCEAPAVKVSPGQVWEVALDAAGGLNLRYIGKRPTLDGL